MRTELRVCANQVTRCKTCLRVQTMQEHVVGVAPSSIAESDEGYALTSHQVAPHARLSFWRGVCMSRSRSIPLPRGGHFLLMPEATLKLRETSARAR